MTSTYLLAADAFVWSAWGELGVRSIEHRSFDIAIDLEPLIRLSSVVGESDSRLRSETAIWLAAFPELISQARLKRIGGEVPKSLTRPRRSESMSGQATLNVASAPVVQLRIRSALGVSARAEIVRQLVLDPPRTRRSSADLAQLCGYTKRTVEKALESLERGGWVSRITGGASLHWAIVDHSAIGGLFFPLPPSNVSFMALAKIVEDLTSLDDVASEGGQVRSATARQLLAELRTTADWGAVKLPPLPIAADAWEVTLAWIGGLPLTAL